LKLKIDGHTGICANVFGFLVYKNMLVCKSLSFEQ